MMRPEFIGFKVNVYQGHHHEIFYVTSCPFTIGRDHEADLMIIDKSISREHLRVSSNGEQMIIEDRGSANGTKVGDAQLDSGVGYVYRAGEQIQLGKGQCYVFIEPIDLLAHYDDESKSALSSLLETKQGQLSKARAKAEAIIKNASQLKQKLSKEAMRAAELTKSEAQTEANRLLDAAKNKVAASIEDAKRLAEEITSNSKENAQSLIEEAELQKQRIEDSLSEMRAKESSIKSGLNELREKEQQARSESEKAYTDWQDIRAKLEEVQSKYSHIKSDLESSTKRLESQEAKYNDLQERYSEQAKNLSSLTEKIPQLEAEKKQLAEEVDKLNTLAKESRERSEGLTAEKEQLEQQVKALSERYTEARNKLMQTQSEAEEQKRQAAKVLKDAEKETKARAEREEKLLRKILKKSFFDQDQLLEQARVKGEKLKEQALVEIEEMKHEAQNQWDIEHGKLRDQWEIEAKAKHEELQKELLKVKKEHDQKLMEEEVVAQSELAAKIEALEKEAFLNRRHEAGELSEHLLVILESKLKMHLKEGTDSQKIHSQLDSAVKRVLLGESHDEEFKAQVFKHNPRAEQAEVKRFYKKLAAVAVVVVVLVISFPFLSSLLEEKARKVASEGSSITDAYAEQVVESWKDRPKFETDKSEIYESNYTDRVLYTVDYPKRELDGAYREQWILDLRVYVVDKLRLHDGVMVPFISKEANLIRKLAEKAGKINPAFVEDGIARLREDEVKFIKEVKELLKTEANYKKLMDYKKKHYLDYHNGN